MGDFGPALTDDQWNRIRQIVHDEALRARVAASFLPLYGPLPGDATTVPADLLLQPGPGVQGTLAVNDFVALRLATVSVNVFIGNHMLADPELAAASIMFRRAANIVARVEDAIIFRGRNTAANPPIPGTETLPQVFTVSGSDTYPGLVGLAPAYSPLPDPPAPPAEPPPVGPGVFKAVVGAINKLEKAAYYKPFACVLADDLFEEIYTPMAGSMVLPADSIPPILNGPLLRSSTLEPGTGLVVSLQGNPVEIVVANDISVRYLQAKDDGEHVFRVSERFVLRVKDNTAIVRIGPLPQLRHPREPRPPEEAAPAVGGAPSEGAAPGEGAAPPKKSPQARNGRIRREGAFAALGRARPRRERVTHRRRGASPPSLERGDCPIYGERRRVARRARLPAAACNACGRGGTVRRRSAATTGRCASRVRPDFVLFGPGGRSAKGRILLYAGDGAACSGRLADC